MGVSQSKAQVTQPRTNRLSKPKTISTTNHGNADASSQPVSSSLTACTAIDMDNRKKTSSRRAKQLAADTKTVSEQDGQVSEKPRKRRSLFVRRKKSHSRKMLPDPIPRHALQEAAGNGSLEDDLHPEGTRDQLTNARELSSRGHDTTEPIHVTPSRRHSQISYLTSQHSRNTSRERIGIANGGDDNRFSGLFQGLSSDFSTFPTRRRSMVNAPGIATRKSSIHEQHELREGSPTNYSTNFGRPELNRGNTQYNPHPSRLPPPARANTVAAPGYSVYQAHDSARAVGFLQRAGQTTKVHSARPMGLLPSTPDANYAYIGKYSLGALRITNGSPSPAVDALGSAEVQSLQSLQPTSGHVRSHSGDSGTSSESSIEEVRFRRRFDTTCGSFVKYQQSDRIAFDNPAHQSADGLSNVLDSSYNAISRTTLGAVPSELSAVSSSANPLKDKGSLSDFSAIGSIHHPIDRQSPTRAFEMAQNYIQEIAANPFSFDDETPRFSAYPAESMRAVHEDELLNDDASRSYNISPSWSLPGIGKRAQSPEDGPGLHPSPTRNRISLEKPDTRAEPEMRSTQEVHEVKPLAKADSGYCSNSSIGRSRSVDIVSQSSSSASPDLIVVSKSDLQVAPSNLQLRKDSLIHKQLQDYTEAQMLPGAFPQELPILIPPISTILPEGLQPSPPNKTVSRHHRGHGYSHSSASDNSTASSSSKKLKLPRIRTTSFSEEIASSLTVQGANAHITHFCSGYIPPVPAAVSARLDERIPPLSHTYKSVSRTNSKETLATTVLSFEESAAPLENNENYVSKRFSLPSAPGHRSYTQDESIPRPAPRKSLDSSRPITQHGRFSTAFRTARKSIDSPRASGASTTALAVSQSPRAKPDEQEWLKVKSREAFEAHVTSFGTVSQSLGASPYDVAMSAMKTPTSNMKFRNMTSNQTAPHRITVANGAEDQPREGRMTGMDAIAAAQYARDRSAMRREQLRREQHSRNSTPEQEYMDGQSNPRFSSSRFSSDMSGVRPTSASSSIHGAERTPLKPVLSNSSNWSEEVERSGWRPMKINAPPPVSMLTRGVSRIPVRAAPQGGPMVNASLSIVNGQSSDGWTGRPSISPQLKQATGTGRTVDNDSGVGVDAEPALSLGPQVPSWIELPSQRRSISSEHWRPKTSPQPPLKPFHVDVQRSQSSQRFRTLAEKYPQIQPSQTPSPLPLSFDNFQPQRQSLPNPSSKPASQTQSSSNTSKQDVLRESSLLSKQSDESLSYSGAHPRLRDRQSSERLTAAKHRMCEAKKRVEGAESRYGSPVMSSPWVSSEDTQGKEELLMVDRYGEHGRVGDLDQAWGVDWRDVPVGKRRSGVEV